MIVSALTLTYETCNYSASIALAKCHTIIARLTEYRLRSVTQFPSYFQLVKSQLMQTKQEGRDLPVTVSAGDKILRNQSCHYFPEIRFLCIQMELIRVCICYGTRRHIL